MQISIRSHAAISFINEVFCSDSNIPSEALDCQKLGSLATLRIRVQNEVYLTSTQSSFKNVYSEENENVYSREKMSLVKRQKCVCGETNFTQSFEKDGSLTSNYMRETLRYVGQEEKVTFLVHHHT